MQCTWLLWVALCVSFAADSARAVDYFWQNATGGGFTEPSSWSPFAPPAVQGPGGALDTVNFDLGAAEDAPYLITDVAGENDRLLVRNDSVHLSVFPSYSIVSTGGISPSLVVGRGSGDVANLILSGGQISRFENDVTRIATNADATGALSVQGLQWTNGNLRVGHVGEGSLRIEEGAVVTSANASLGHLPNSRGFATVENATWNVSGDLLVGREGDGTLSLSTGATLDTPNVTIGSEPTSVGTASIRASSASWVVRDTLNIGTAGDGSLSVIEGDIAAAAVNVGGLPASDGFVSISGGHFTTTGLFTIGGTDVGPTLGGSGLVRVASGGIEAQGGIRITPNGVLELQSSAIVANAITVEGPTGQFNFTGGSLSVDEFNGDLTNAGGNMLPNPGTTVNGDYIGLANSVLSYVVEGPAADNSYGSLTITGSAALGQFLFFGVSSLFEPSGEDVYVLLSASELLGEFYNIESGQRVDSSNGNGSFIVYYGPESPFDPNQVVLTSYLPPGPAGDYNNNGVVDAADYTLWRDNLGAPNGTLLNDIHLGPIDQDQYNTWKANFGTSGAGALGGQSVPEPNVIAHFIFGAPLLLRRIRRFRRAPPEWWL